MTMPFSAAIRRNPEMMNSRATTIIVNQAGSSPKEVRQIMAEVTRSLSARGSMNLPKFVMRFLDRAIFPSAISVREAAMKMASATSRIVRLSGKTRRKTTKKGIIKTRSMVSLFGRFIFID